MHVLRLLAARRAVSTITAAAHSKVPDSEPEEDEGPFFDLDFSSVRASSSSSGSDESDDACSEDLDFIISLHRSRSASPFCASQRSTKANLRTLSFGGAKKKKKAAAAFDGGRPSFASSTRSLRLFMESPADDEEDDVTNASEPTKRGAPSIRRYLTKISRRLRSVRPRSAASGDAGGLQRRLRKSRSASAAVTLASAPASSRRDDSLIEKQDGIASAIAHCKESFHRASLSEKCDSSLLRSRSDPGWKCQNSAKKDIAKC